MSEDLDPPKSVPLTPGAGVPDWLKTTRGAEPTPATVTDEEAEMNRLAGELNLGGPISSLFGNMTGYGFVWGIAVATWWYVRFRSDRRTQLDH